MNSTPPSGRGTSNGPADARAFRRRREATGTAVGLALVLAGSLVAGCSKKSATESPAEGSPGAVAPEARDAQVGSRDLESLQRDLAAQAGELASMSNEEHGVAASDDQARCTRICQLEGSICDIADAICQLADEHLDDPKYTDGCTEARAQCARAEEACNACGG